MNLQEFMGWQSLPFEVTSWIQHECYVLGRLEGYRKMVTYYAKHFDDLLNLIASESKIIENVAILKAPADELNEFTRYLVSLLKSRDSVEVILRGGFKTKVYYDFSSSTFRDVYVPDNFGWNADGSILSSSTCFGDDYDIIYLAED